MRSSTRTVLAVALLLPAPTLAAAAGFHVVDDEAWCREEGRGNRPRYCEVREATLPGGPLAVDARPNGGIAVRGWDRGEVRVRARIVATGDDPGEARETAGAVQIEAGTTVRATGPARGSARSWWVSYRVDVPRDTHVSLQADNGGLHVSDLVGDVEMHTVNGGIHVDGSGGRIAGETVNGGIHLRLDGHEWRGQGLDLRTTNGGLHLEIPRDYDARLEVGTVNGGVRSDVPVTTHGRWTGGRIDTDLGRGGSLVKVETTNGGLHLSRR
jgi:hypothetical protein